MDVLSVHMDNCPLYKALLTLEEKKATGRMTIEEHNGQNHMYFMQGMPVGVQTSKYLAPLGQLLLERNLCDATTFINAQRRIRDGGGLLPGQVFMGMGVINEDQLKEILAIQSTRKAQHFCKLGSRSFTFSKGLTFLTGFQPTPMDMHMLVFLAVSQQLTKKVRERFLELLNGKDVRLKDCGDGLLPAPLEVYGFGPAEKRFLSRLNQQFQPIWELLESGALLRDDTATLLRYLQVEGLLEVRKGTPRPEPEPEGEATLDPEKLQDFKSKEKLPVSAKPRRPKTGPRKKTRRLEPLPSDVHPLVVCMPGPPQPVTEPLPSMIIAPQIQ